MHKKIKIDNHVPPPDNALGPTGRGHWIKLLNEMEDGSSVLLDCPTKANALYMTGKVRGIRMTTRRERGGWRIWRIGFEKEIK